MSEILITWAALTATTWIAASALPAMEIQGGVVGRALVSAGFGLTMLVTGWACRLVIGVLAIGPTLLLALAAQILAGALLFLTVDALTDRVRVGGPATALLVSMIAGVVGSIAGALAHAI